MKKLSILATTLLLSLGTANASLNDNSRNHLVSYVANSMKHLNSTQPTPMQVKQKHELAACMIDSLVDDFKEHDIHPTEVKSYISEMAVYFTLGPDFNSRVLDQYTIAYMEELEYKCIDHHVSKNDAINAKIRAFLRTESNCDSDDMYCRVQVYQNMKSELDAKHGL